MRRSGRLRTGHDRTAPHLLEAMLGADPHEPSPAPSAELIRSAFHELHGRRLHGFALLLAIGDRRRAAVLTADAMAAADAHLAELRHPERAAAWLRAHVTRAAGRDDRRVQRTDRVAALADLGVGGAVFSGLSALSRLERAGLIATAVERLDRRDVGMVVGRDGPRLDDLLRRARRRYLRAAVAVVKAGGTPGPIARRIAASAARTMA